MWMVSQSSNPHPGDINAQDAAGEDSVMNVARFDLLCERWRHQEDPDTTAARPSEAVQRSIECARTTLEPYISCFSASDLQLYGQWMAARHKEDIKALLFDCFQLICRMRGPAVAVVRTQEIARWIG